mmetsp:Transcript_924/g.1816  ORF Transcript_924/g.1816 Transcript_924/m.1816 type:complete len:99 (+) Transcript_924:67-363(+)
MDAQAKVHALEVVWPCQLTESSRFGEERGLVVELLSLSVLTEPISFDGNVMENLREGPVCARDASQFPERALRRDARSLDTLTDLLKNDKPFARSTTV